MEEIPGLYQHLVDHSPVARGSWTRRAPRSGSPPSSARCWGAPPGSSTGWRPARSSTPTGQAQFGEFLQRMRSRGGREPEVECLVHRPDGTSKWVMIGASTLRS